MERIAKVGLALVCSILAVQSIGETSIKGYGSFKAGVGSEDTTFSRGVYGEDWSGKQESAFGLQFKSDVNEKTSTTVQILARGDEGSADFEAEFNWAFVDYEVNDTVSVAVGRIVLPLFYYSDFLNVGYAYTTVVPPRSVYSLTIFDSADGVSVKTANFVGDFYLTTNVFMTRWEESTNTFGNINGIQVSLSGDTFSLFGIYSFMDNATFEVAELTAAVEGAQTGGLTDSQAAELLMEDDPARFVGVGTTADINNILLNFELTQTVIEDSVRLPDTNWYLMAGYRFNKFIPYVMYETTSNDPDSVDVSDWGPFESIGQAIIDSRELSYSANTIGIRWDFDQSMALKFQHTMYSDIIDGEGDFGSDGDEETFSESMISIDIVY